MNLTSSEVSTVKSALLCFKALMSTIETLDPMPANRKGVEDALAILDKDEPVKDNDGWTLPFAHLVRIQAEMDQEYRVGLEEIEAVLLATRSAEVWIDIRKQAPAEGQYIIAKTRDAPQPVMSGYWVADDNALCAAPYAGSDWQWCFTHWMTPDALLSDRQSTPMITLTESAWMEMKAQQKSVPMEMLKRLYQTNSSGEWVLIAKRDFGYAVTESGKEEG